MEKDVKKNILVPTDFSKVAECALSHAIVMAKKLNTEITLLHIIGKQTELLSAKEKLDKIATETSQASGLKINVLIREGNIFDKIGAIASEIDAMLIIMGTHGIKGIQHITGSHANKVITHSKVPFIVVQEKGIKKGYDEIVLPLDFDKETKQKIKLTIEIAKAFNSKIFIITPKQNDEFLRNATNRNLAFTKHSLEKNNIAYEVTVADVRNSFTKEIIKYAGYINADLIVIVKSEDVSLLPEFMGSSDDQLLITNSPQIPVLCVNAVKVTKYGGILGRAYFR
jgi:nucleotide-binding universal stress UspA family protein